MKYLRQLLLPILNYSFQSNMTKYPGFLIGSGNLNMDAINEVIFSKTNYSDDQKDTVLNYFRPILTESYFAFNMEDKKIGNHLNLKYSDNEIKEITLKLNVPRNFNSKLFQDIVRVGHNYELISLDKKNVPQCLVDLKSFINSKTIINEVDLDTKIFKFNDLMMKKIQSFYKY